MTSIAALFLFCGAAFACERRRVPSTSVGDAATTGAPIPAGEHALEPAVGDASTTSASIPAAEQALEASGDAGDTSRRSATEPALPRWVPKDAPLSIIQAGDRDRNLGIVPPPAPAKVTVDAGGIAVDIEVRRAP